MTESCAFITTRQISAAKVQDCKTHISQRELSFSQIKYSRDALRQLQHAEQRVHIPRFAGTRRETQAEGERAVP